MRKLFRSRHDAKVGGLCGGLAAYLGVDATIIRLLALVALFCSFGTAFLFYIIGCLFVPKEPHGGFHDNHSFY